MLVACSFKGGGKVTAPPTPAPAPTPAPVVTTPVPAPGGTQLLDQLAAAGWRLDALTLPAVEQRYQDQSGENPDYRQLAYQGGALRLYVAPGGQDVFALVVDTADQNYAAFAQLQDGQGYRVYQDGNLVAVVRSNPADPSKFTGRSWTLTDLQAQLGAPSYSYHLHGVGDYVYVYAPQGLVFQGTPGSAVPQDGTATAENVQRGLAKSLTGDLKLVAGALAKGKRSADGSATAGLMARGGYWDNWIVVKPAGKAEQRYQTGYFVQDYFWLDDHRIVYAEMMNPTFYVIDINTGSRAAGAKVEGEVQAFGVDTPGKVWYKGPDGARHEVAIP
jgi:hypothetical protein